MIGRLSGQIVDRDLDGTCIVDVNGVGYEVSVPASMVHALPNPPATATLSIHTQVREDAITLFGFPSERDREAFRTILGVSGVGPRIALSVLSSLSVDELSFAIARGDAAAFKAVSGVGKKLAERMLLELKDKLPAGAIPIGIAKKAATLKPTPEGPSAIVVGALVQMGYKLGQAEAAVAQIHDLEARPVDELLREALAHLG
ncbi:MAG: Holliday junction branch migration protein RuvA [Polyangiales bacterium]|nr:Holliday junction branch migration protein RuvA [Myxococcales bacterium]